MFVFLVFDLVFTTKPRDWLGRASLKWPILCWVGHKTLTPLVKITKMLVDTLW